MKKALYFSFLLLLAAGWSYGQTNELSFSAGATFMTSQTRATTFPTLVPCTIPNCNVITNTLDASTGFTFETSYARRLVGTGPVALYLELPVVETPGHGIATVLSDPFVSPINGSTSSSLFFLTPSARVKFFPSARISPWATVGGGWARLSEGAISTNLGALQFGGGVDFKTGVPHLGLRAEARDFWSASVRQSEGVPTAQLTATTVSPDHQHHLFAGGGVVLRF